MKHKGIIILLTVMSLTFTGCVPIPGAPVKPFGETHYAEDRAKPEYERFTEKLLEEAPEEWDGYTLSVRTSSVTSAMDIDIYYTEEYTVAYAEGKGEYLWYQGMLFYSYGGKLACRELPWEAVSGAELVTKTWDFAMQMAAREDAELEFKHIPMANGRAYRLQADYPETELADGSPVNPRLSVRLDGDGAFDSFTAGWQYIGDREDLTDNIEFSVGFYGLPGSTNLQAERKIWSFGHDWGLSERGVPALSEQSDNREACRMAIQAMDFTGLAAQAVRDDTLTFPSFSFGESAEIMEE